MIRSEGGNVMSKTLEEKIKKIGSKFRLLGISDYEFKVDCKRKAYVKIDGKLPDFDIFANIVQEIEEVDKEAFGNYITLEKMLFNPQIKIGEFAFAACKKLKEIIILDQTNQKVSVSNWNSGVAKGIQLEPGVFGGCAKLKNIKNIPAIAGPFFKLHFEGLQCYADVNGIKKGLKIGNWNYTTMPNNKAFHEELALYLLLFTTLLSNFPGDLLCYLTHNGSLPELDLEFVYNDNNSDDISDIVLRKIWNKNWNENGIPTFGEIENLSLEDLISDLKDKLGEAFKAVKEKDLKDLLNEIVYTWHRNSEKNGKNANLQKEEELFPIIPLFVTQIGSGAFDDWTWIKELVIPDHINRIESGAFTNCKNLKKVHVPEKVTIEDGAFSSDTEIVLY